MNIELTTYLAEHRMDKDVLRIIILLVGLLVVAGIIIWNFFKYEQARKEFDDFEALNNHDNQPDFQDDFDTKVPTTDSLQAKIKAQTQKMKLSSIVQAGLNLLDPISKDVINSPRMELPEVLQFSLIADNEQGFNGMELMEVLKDVGLEYGNLQIFERLDKRRLVDFGVANIVKPGIFPNIDVANFYSPGIVFFMQLDAVDDSVMVFEDFIRTINFVNMKLNGKLLDHKRQPLTNSTIHAIRQNLV